MCVCVGGYIAYNHDRWEVASRVCDVVDSRWRLGGLSGRSEERLRAKPVVLACHQTGRGVHPGPGAGETHGRFPDGGTVCKKTPQTDTNVDVSKLSFFSGCFPEAERGGSLMS